MQSSQLNTSQITLSGQRVIFVFNTLDLGGAERQGLLLARHLLREERALVEVWAFIGPGRAAELCDEWGIPWRVVPVAWGAGRARRARALFRLAAALRRARPRVLLPYTVLPNVLCGLVWRWTGARLCVWNQRDEGRGLTGTRHERQALAGTPLFISNSHHGAGLLTASFGVPPAWVRVVYNGVEPPVPEGDRQSWREHLAVSESCFLACMVANLHDYKDHATLLRAWRRVADAFAADGREAVLLLAGRFDTTHDRLKALAYDLELGRAVRFLDKVDDVAGLLTAVELGVFSSRCEGVPNGVLECMASGLAVAGTDIPGIREALGEDNLPWLAPPGDDEALAARILALAADPGLRASLGEQNRRRAAGVFAPERMCAEMTAAIVDGLAHKGGS
jgi:glycosyltransferase involved in cell wall biosynthesis